MAIKLIIVVVLLLVVINLFQALFSMLRDDKQRSMTHFLGRRLLLCGLIIASLLSLLFFGIIEPNSRPY